MTLEQTLPPPKHRRQHREAQERRRLAAALRVVDRAKRTDEQQLAHLDSLGFVAAKERAKLAARIAKQAAEAAKKVETKTAEGEKPKAKRAKKKPSNEP